MAIDGECRQVSELAMSCAPTSNGNKASYSLGCPPQIGHAGSYKGNIERATWHLSFVTADLKLSVHLILPAIDELNVLRLFRRSNHPWIISHSIFLLYRLAKGLLVSK